MPKLLVVLVGVVSFAIGVLMGSWGIPSLGSADPRMGVVEQQHVQKLNQDKGTTARSGSGGGSDLESLLKPTTPEDYFGPANLLSNNVPISAGHGCVGVVLQVYKRSHLGDQLVAAVNQTANVCRILVVSSGPWVPVASVIDQFRSIFTNVPVEHAAFSRNARFHTRFHLAYLMQEEYVSVWDDDILPGPGFLEKAVAALKKEKGRAVVGGNGRVWTHVAPPDRKGGRWVRKRDESVEGGQVDFVGHSWTMPRVLLRQYLGMPPFTYFTGEDVQMAFAFQQLGVKMITLPIGSKYASPDVMSTVNTWSSGPEASFKNEQRPRYLLFCRILLAGFRTLDCDNCHDPEVLKDCVTRVHQEAREAEELAIAQDDLSGGSVWSLANASARRSTRS